MKEMWRRIPAVAFALAFILIAEPLLHAHPLSSDSDVSAQSRTCGVCATGVHQLPSSSPAIAAPATVLYLLSAAQAWDALAAPAISFDSRGPPRS